jgi:hypothetical protein
VRQLTVTRALVGLLLTDRRYDAARIFETTGG